MDMNETLKVLTYLQTAYPMFYRGQTKQQAVDTARLWQYHFADYDVNLVAAAVNKLIATRTDTFPPVIGEVHEMLNSMKTNGERTPMEAWNYILKAIRNGIYGSQEEWNRLPEDIKSLVSPEQIRSWAMDNAFNEEVASSNFMRSYKQAMEQKKKEQMTPANIQGMIDMAKYKQQKLEGSNGGGDRRYRLPEDR